MKADNVVSLGGLDGRNGCELDNADLILDGFGFDVTVVESGRDNLLHSIK